jgi:hypothetical protein
MQIVADAFEQSFAAAEERRHDADFHLVYESSGEILLRGTRASG